MMAIDHLQSRNATVVLVGYGPKFPEKNAKLRELAQKYNARVIDAEDVAASEGVHPSPTGYASMAGKSARCTRRQLSCRHGAPQPRRQG